MPPRGSGIVPTALPAVPILLSTLTRSLPSSNPDRHRSTGGSNRDRVKRPAVGARFGLAGADSGSPASTSVEGFSPAADSSPATGACVPSALWGVKINASFLGIGGGAVGTKRAGAGRWHALAAMLETRRLSTGLKTAILTCALAATGAAGDRSGAAKDPLAAEIERWSAFLRESAATDQDSTQVKAVSQPVLAAAAEGLRAGRRSFALARLAAVSGYLSASRYLSEIPPAKLNDPAAFESEWARTGLALRDDLGGLSPGALSGVQPAAVRAVGEAALPQVKAYYEASLDFGRNTMARSGLFYIGTALGQRDFVRFCRSLSTASGRRAPGLRSIAGELDRLEGEILEAYRPPASIDRHGEFISASATLNEARQLDAAGLRYGALLRYLQAALGLAPLRPSGPPLAAAALAARLAEFDRRLTSGDVDHTIGRIFLEAAQSETAGAPTGVGSGTAAAVVGDVLPRYFAALEPARREPPKPEPRVTVTLVRWPYT